MHPVGGTWASGLGRMPPSGLAVAGQAPGGDQHLYDTRMRTRGNFLASLLFLAVVAIVIWWHPFEHWLAYATGSYNTPGVAHNYNFFSGSGSDLGEYAIAGAVLSGLGAWYHKHNCHTDRCYRVGKHPTARR